MFTTRIVQQKENVDGQLGGALWDEFALDTNNDDFDNEDDDVDEDIEEDEIENDVDDTNDDLDDVKTKTNESQIDTVTDDVDNEEDDMSEPINIFSKELADKGLIDLDDNVEIKSTEDLFKAVETRLEKEKKNLVEKLNPYVRQLQEFVDAGGSPEDFLSKGYIDYEEYDIEDEGTQKSFITRKLKMQGVADDEIAEQLELYKTSGKLKQFAEKAKAVLVDTQKKQLEATVARQKEATLAIENKKIEFAKTISNVLTKTPTVLGEKISQKEAKQLEDFIFVVDKKTGKTAFQKFFEEGTEEERASKIIASAYIALTKGNPEKLVKKLETKAVSKLEESLSKLNKNKKNESGKGKLRLALD